LIVGVAVGFFTIGVAVGLIVGVAVGLIVGVAVGFWTIGVQLASSQVILQLESCFARFQINVRRS